MTVAVLLIFSISLLAGLAAYANLYTKYKQLYDEARTKLESTRGQLRTREVSNTLMDERIRELSQEIAGFKEAQGYMADTLKHRNHLLESAETTLAAVRVDMNHYRASAEHYKSALSKALNKSVKRKKQSTKRYPEGQAGPGRPKTSAKRKPKA